MHIKVGDFHPELQHQVPRLRRMAKLMRVPGVSESLTGFGAERWGAMWRDLIAQRSPYLAAWMITR